MIMKDKENKQIKFQTLNKINLPILGIMTIEEILAHVIKILKEKKIVIYPKTKFKLRAAIEIMGLRERPKPMRIRDIKAETINLSFGFGKCPDKEIRRALDYLILGEAVIKIRKGKTPHYWLLYKIKRIKEKNEDNHIDIFDLWRRYSTLNGQIQEFMIPESSEGIIKILIKIRRCAGDMKFNCLKLEKREIQFYNENLIDIIRFAEVLERCYYTFSDTEELPKEIEMLVLKISKCLASLTILIDKSNNTRE